MSEIITSNYYEVIDGTTMYYEDYVEQLQKEIEELKQKYEMQKDSNKLLCKAITCDNCDCSICEAHKENIKLQQENKELKEKSILTEFENWLIDTYYIYVSDIANNSIAKIIYDKLQELKEGKK